MYMALRGSGGTLYSDSRKNGNWWSLQCVELPGAMSQVKDLAEAHIITEAIAYVGEVNEADIVLAIQPVLPFSINSTRKAGTHGY